MNNSVRFRKLPCIASIPLAAFFATSCAHIGDSRSASPMWQPAAAPSQLDAPGAQWIKVDASGGHKMLAAVYRPGPGTYPVVVILFGASGLQPANLSLARELSQAGFMAVVGCWQAVASPPAPKPNPVCSEAPPQMAWQRDPAANSGKELIAAARMLPGARPDRIGLYGISRGGNAALWAASTGAGVQAVVADSPPHRPPRVNPAPPSTEEVLPNLSAPTLILQGTADRVVPVEQARDYEGAAKRLGRPVTVVYFEGVGHMTSYPVASRESKAMAAARTAHVAESRSRALAFLREHLMAP